MKQKMPPILKNDEAYLTDEQILDLYWLRDENAIRQTDRKYGKYLYVIAYNIVHDRLDCEECLNDTYLGTWNRIPPQRPNVFQVFLSRIMRNIAIDRLRHNRAAKRVPSEMLVSLEELDDCMPGAPSTESEQETEPLARVLNDFVHALDDRKQFIFVCRYYYADKVSSIAHMLQIGEATVFRELADIRKGLKNHLEKEGYALG